MQEKMKAGFTGNLFDITGITIVIEMTSIFFYSILFLVERSKDTSKKHSEGVTKCSSWATCNLMTKFTNHNMPSVLPNFSVLLF